MGYVSKLITPFGPALFNPTPLGPITKMELGAHLGPGQANVLATFDNFKFIGACAHQGCGIVLPILPCFPAQCSITLSESVLGVGQHVSSGYGQPKHQRRLSC